MTQPTRTPLGDTASARDYWYDVWDPTLNTGAGGYVAVMGVSNQQLQFTPSWNDQSDNDSKGFGSQNKVAEQVVATLELRRAPGVTTPTAYDPGQEVLRKAGPGKMGSANRVKVRAYEMGTARVEAWEGYAGVDWQENGGGNTDDRTIACVLQGKGQWVAITHPNPGP